VKSLVFGVSRHPCRYAGARAVADPAGMIGSVPPAIVDKYDVMWPASRTEWPVQGQIAGDRSSRRGRMRDGGRADSTLARMVSATSLIRIQNVSLLTIVEATLCNSAWRNHNGDRFQWQRRRTHLAAEGLAEKIGWGCWRVLDKKPEPTPTPNPRPVSSLAPIPLARLMARR
jgi:hypothetical protein